MSQNTPPKRTGCGMSLHQICEAAGLTEAEAAAVITRLGRLSGEQTLPFQQVADVAVTVLSVLTKTKGGVLRNQPPRLMGLSNRMIEKLTVWARKAGAAGLPNPLGFITSGYRSQERQAQLIRQWESGDRTGLVARPARNSRHIKGEAVDLSSDAPLEDLARIWVSMGGRWGGHFFPNKDPNHFDLG